MTNDAQGGAELNAGAENSPADGGVGGGAMNAMPMAVEAVTGEKSRTSDQAALDLLCCPFCGAKPKTNNGGHSTFGRLWWCVWCDECQFEMRDQEVWLKDGSGRLDPAYPPRHCFSAWNLRAALAAPSAPAEVAGLVGKLLKADRGYEPGTLFTEAATVLTALQAENERLREELSAEKGMLEQSFQSAEELAVMLAKANKRAKKAEAELAAWKVNADALATKLHAITSGIPVQAVVFETECRAALAALAKLKGEL